MNTVTIQIGNSDDKLTQKEWSKFIFDVGGVVSRRANEIYFSGGSNYNTSWQNACWVFDASIEDINEIRLDLKALKIFFKQDSIALTIGNTEFI